jgi:Predicted membrane protein
MHPALPVFAFTWPAEAYLWFKTLHIVGVVVWFAGALLFSAPVYLSP